MEEVRKQLAVINDPNSSVEKLSAAVDIVADSVDVGFTTEYSDYVKEVIPAVQTLLEQRLSVQFERNETYRVRHTAVLILYRLPMKTPLGEHLETVMPLLMDVAASDNEENAVICIKKFYELQQHFRYSTKELFKKFHRFALSGYMDALEVANYLFPGSFDKPNLKKSSKTTSTSSQSSYDKFLTCLSSQIAKDFFARYNTEQMITGEIVLPGCCSFRILRDVPLVAKLMFYIHKQEHHARERSSRTGDQAQGEGQRRSEDTGSNFDEIMKDFGELLKQIAAFLTANVSARKGDFDVTERNYAYPRRIEFVTAQVKGLLFAVFMSSRFEAHFLAKTLRMHLCLQLFHNIPIETTELWGDMIQIFKELIKLRTSPKNSASESAVAGDTTIASTMSEFMTEANRVMCSPTINVYVLSRIYGVIQELVLQLQDSTDVTTGVLFLCKGLNDHRLPLTSHLAILNGLIRSAGQFVKQGGALQSDTRRLLSDVLITMIKKVGSLSYMVPSVILASKRAWQRLERLRQEEARMNSHAVSVAAISRGDMPYNELQNECAKSEWTKLCRTTHGRKVTGWGAGRYHFSLGQDVESDDDAEESNEESINQADNLYADPTSSRLTPNKKPNKACLTPDEMEISSAIEASGLLKRLITNLISGICTTAWIISNYGEPERNVHAAARGATTVRKPTSQDESTSSRFTDEELTMFRRLLCWGLRCFRMFCAPSEKWPNLDIASDELSPTMPELTSVDAETASLFHSFAHIFSMFRETILHDVLRGMMPFIFRHMLICPQLILVMSRWLILESTSKPFTQLLADFLTKHVHLLNPVDPHEAVKPVENVVSCVLRQHEKATQDGHSLSCTNSCRIPILTDSRPLVYMPGFIDLVHPAAPFVSEVTSLSLFPAPLRAFIIRWLLDKMFFTVSKNEIIKVELTDNVVVLITGILRDAFATSDPDGHLLVLANLFSSFSRSGSSGNSLTIDAPEIARLLLRNLLSLHAVVRKTEQKDKIIELCLIMPAKLSTQLPNLAFLVRPLLLGLNSKNAQTTNAALNIFRTWADRLNPEYLFPILDQASGTLKGILGSLCNFLKPNVPKELAKQSLSILGVLGGRNRWHLVKPPCLSPTVPHSSGNDISTSIRYKGESGSVSLRLGKLVSLAFVQLNRHVDLSETCTKCSSPDHSRDISMDNEARTNSTKSYRYQRAVEAVERAGKTSWSDSDSNSDHLVESDEEQYPESNAASENSSVDERRRHSKKASWHFIRNIAERLVNERRYSPDAQQELKYVCSQPDMLSHTSQFGNSELKAPAPGDDTSEKDDIITANTSRSEFVSSDMLRKVFLSVAIASADRDFASSAKRVLDDLVECFALDCVAEGINLIRRSKGSASSAQHKLRSTRENLSRSVLVETIVSLACGNSLNQLLPVAIEILHKVYQTFNGVYGNCADKDSGGKFLIYGPTGYFFRSFTLHAAHAVSVHAWQAQIGSLCCLLASMNLFPLEWTHVYQDVIMKCSFHALKQHTMHFAGSVCYAARATLDCLFRLRYLSGAFYRRRHLRKLPKDALLVRMKVPSDAAASSLFLAFAWKPDKSGKKDSTAELREGLHTFSKMTLSDDDVSDEDVSGLDQEDIFYNRVAAEGSLVPLGFYLGDDATTIVITSRREVQSAFLQLQPLFDSVTKSKGSAAGGGSVIEHMTLADESTLFIGGVPVHEVRSPLDELGTSSRGSSQTNYLGTTPSTRNARIVPRVLLCEKTRASFSRAVDLAAHELVSFCGTTRHASWVFLLRLAKLVRGSVEELLEHEGSVDWKEALPRKLYRYSFGTLSAKDKIGQLKAIYFLLKKMPGQFPVNSYTVKCLQGAVDECKKEDIKSRFTRETEIQAAEGRCTIGADADPEDLYSLKLASSPIPYQWPDPFALGWPTFDISVYVSHRYDLQNAKARWYTRGNGNLPPSESPLMRSSDEQHCPPIYIPGVSDGAIVDEFKSSSEGSSEQGSSHRTTQQSLFEPLLFSNAVSYSYSRSGQQTKERTEQDPSTPTQTPIRRFLQNKFYEAGTLLKLSQPANSSIAFDLLACSSFAAATACPLDFGDFLTKRGNGEYSVGGGICSLSGGEREHDENTLAEDGDAVVPSELEALFSRRDNCLYPYPWDSSIATRAFQDSSTYDVMSLSSAADAHEKVNFTYPTYAEILYITVAELIAIIYQEPANRKFGTKEGEAISTQIVADRDIDESLQKTCQDALSSLFDCFISSNTAVIASVYESLKLVFDFYTQTNGVQKVLNSVNLKDFLRPLIENLSLPLDRIDIKCSVGLSYVLLLHPTMFENKLRDKVIKDLKALCDPGQQTSFAVKPGLITSLLSLIHFFPSNEGIVSDVLHIYLSLSRDYSSHRISSICSPFLQPVSRILSSHPQETIEAFLTAPKETLLIPEGSSLLLNLLRHPVGKPLRAELTSDHGVKLIMEKLLDAPDSIADAASSGVPKAENARKANQLRYYGMKIIRVITKNSPRILSFHKHALASKLKTIWLQFCECNPASVNFRNASISARLCVKILLSYVRMFPIETNVIFSLLSAFRIPTLTDFSFLQTFFLRELPYSTPLPLRRQYVKYFLHLVSSNSTDDSMNCIALRLWIIPLIRVSLRASSRQSRQELTSPDGVPTSENDSVVANAHYDEEEQCIVRRLFTQKMLHNLVETLYTEGNGDTGTPELHTQLLRLGCLLFYHEKDGLSCHKKTMITYGYHQAKGDEMDVRAWALLFISIFLSSYSGHLDSDAAVNTFVRALRTPFGLDTDTTVTCRPQESSQLSLVSSKLAQKALHITAGELVKQFDEQVLSRAAKYSRLILCEKFRALHVTHVWQVVREHEGLFYRFRDELVPVLIHHLTTLAIPSSSGGQTPVFGVDLVTIFINWEVRERKENLLACEKDKDGTIKGKCSGLASRFREETKRHVSITIVSFLIRAAVVTCQKKDMKGVSRRCIRLLHVALYLWPNVTISVDVFQHMLSESSREYQKARESASSESRSRGERTFSTPFRRILDTKKRKWEQYSKRDFSITFNSIQPYGIVKCSPVEPCESLLYMVLRCILEILRCPGDGRYFVVTNTGLIMLLLAPVAGHESTRLWTLFRKVLRRLLSQFPLARPSVQMKHTKFYLWLIRCMSNKLLTSLDLNSDTSAALSNATEDMAAPQFQRGFGETVVRLVSLIHGLDAMDMTHQWNPTNVSPDYNVVLDTKYPNPIPPRTVSRLSERDGITWNRHQITDEVMAACAQEYMSVFMQGAEVSSLYELHILRVLKELGKDDYSTFDPLIQPLFKWLKMLVQEQLKERSHHRQSKRSENRDKVMYRVQSLKILIRLFSKRIRRLSQSQRDEFIQILCTLAQKSQKSSVSTLAFGVLRDWLLTPTAETHSTSGLVQSEKSNLLNNMSAFGGPHGGVGTSHRRTEAQQGWLQKEYFKLLFELYYGRLIEDEESHLSSGHNENFFEESSARISNSSIIFYGQYGLSEAVNTSLFDVLQKGAERGDGSRARPSRPPSWLAAQLRKQITPGCCAESEWVRRESLRVVVDSAIEGRLQTADTALPFSNYGSRSDRLQYKGSDSAATLALKLLLDTPSEIFGSPMWISILVRIALVAFGDYRISNGGRERTDTASDPGLSKLVHLAYNDTSGSSAVAFDFSNLFGNVDGTDETAASHVDAPHFVDLLADLSTCDFSFSRELWLQIFPALWQSSTGEEKKAMLPRLSSMLVADYHQRYTEMSYGIDSDSSAVSYNSVLRTLHVPEPLESSQSVYLTSGIKNFISCGMEHLPLPNLTRSSLMEYYSEQNSLDDDIHRNMGFSWGNLSIEVFFEGIAQLGETIPLRTEVLIYVAKKFRCWSLVMPILERQLRYLEAGASSYKNTSLAKPSADPTFTRYRSIEEKLGMPKGFFSSASSGFSGFSPVSAESDSDCLQDADIFAISPLPGSESDVGMLSASRLDALVKLYRSLEYDDLMVGVQRYYSHNSLAHIAMTLSSHGDWENSLDTFKELLQQPVTSTGGRVSERKHNGSSVTDRTERRTQRHPKLNMQSSKSHVEPYLRSLIPSHGSRKTQTRKETRVSDEIMCKDLFRGKGVKRCSPSSMAGPTKSQKTDTSVSKPSLAISASGEGAVSSDKQTVSAVEHQWWEARWIESARSLCEWPVLNAYGQATGDPVLMSEATSRLGEWHELSTLLSTHAVRLALSSEPETKLLEAESYLQNDELRRSYTTVDEAAELLKRKWWELPSNVHAGFAHQRLLCLTQLFTEVKEAALTMDACSRGNDGSSALHICIASWRDRLPNVWEGIPVWDHLLTWRYNFFNRIIRVLANRSDHRASHDAAWTVIRLAKTGRKLNLPKVCMRSIARCAKLAKMEYPVNYMRNREHILIALQNSITSGGQDLSECNIVSARPSKSQSKTIGGIMATLLGLQLRNFEPTEKSELLRLQGLVCAHMGAQTWKESHDAFSASVKIEPENSLSWLTWGNFLCKLFRFVQPPLDDFSREFQRHSQEPPVANRRKKESLMKSKVSSHLKHLAETEAGVVDAINAVMQSSGKNVPPNPNRSSKGAGSQASATHDSSESANDARLDFTDLGRLMNANVDVAEPLEIATQAIIAYLMAVVHGCDKPASQLARVLWLLQYDDEQGRLGHILRHYGVQVTTWLWVHWMPQLFSALSSPSVDSVVSIIASVMQRFPQAVVYHLREYVAIKTELKQQELTWSVTSREIPLEDKNGRKYKARAYSDTKALKEFCAKGGKTLTDNKPIDIEKADTLPKPFTYFPPVYDTENGTSVRTRKSQKNDDDAGIETPSSEEQDYHQQISGEEALRQTKLYEVSMYSTWCATRLLRLLKVSHGAGVDEVSTLIQVLLQLGPGMWDDFYGRIDTLISRCWMLTNAFDEAIPEDVIRNLSLVYQAQLARLQRWDQSRHDSSESSREVLEEFLESFAKDLLQEVPPESESGNQRKRKNPNFPSNISELVGRLKKWRRCLQRRCQGETGNFSSADKLFSIADRRFSVAEIPGQYGESEYLHNSMRPRVRLHHIEASVTTVQNRFSHLLERHVTLAGADGRLYHFAVETMSHQQTASDVLAKQMQVLFNELFSSHNDSRSRLLGAEAPSVIPLDHRHRMAAVDPQSLTFGDVFSQYCSDHGKDDDFVASRFRTLAQEEEASLCRAYHQTHLQGNLGSESANIPEHDMGAIHRRAMVLAFERICNESVPSDIISKYLSRWFSCPDDFAVFKSRFTRQYAVACLMAFLLSLNEKSAHRISFSLSSGSVSIVEVKPNFSPNHFTLKQTDAVPFRMTRNVEQFLTPYGVLGPFANSFVAAAGALNSYSEWMKCYMGLYFRDELVRHKLRGQLTHDTGMRRVTDELQGTLQGNVNVFMRRISRLQPSEARKVWNEYRNIRKNETSSSAPTSEPMSAINTLGITSNGAEGGVGAGGGSSTDHDGGRASSSDQAAQLLNNHEDKVFALIRDAQDKHNICQMPWAWQPWF